MADSLDAVQDGGTYSMAELRRLGLGNAARGALSRAAGNDPAHLAGMIARVRRSGPPVTVDLESDEEPVAIPRDGLGRLGDRVRWGRLRSTA